METVCTSNAKEVRLVEADSEALNFFLRGHTDEVLMIAFLDGRSKLASGSLGGTCKGWDSSTGAIKRTIELGSEVASVEWGRD